MIETKKFILKKAVEDKKINIHLIIDYKGDESLHSEYAAAALSLKKIGLLHSEENNSPIMYITDEGIKANKRGLKLYLSLRYLNKKAPKIALISVIVNIFFGFLNYYQNDDHKTLKTQHDSLISKCDSLKSKYDFLILKSDSLESHLKTYKDSLFEMKYKYNQQTLEMSKATSKTKKQNHLKN